MFVELMPLLNERTLPITVARLDEKLKVSCFGRATVSLANGLLSRRIRDFEAQPCRTGNTFASGGQG